MLLWEQPPASYLWHRVRGYDGCTSVAFGCWLERGTGSHGFRVPLVVAMNYRCTATEGGRVPVVPTLPVVVFLMEDIAVKVVLDGIVGNRYCQA